MKIAVTVDPEIPVPPQYYGGIERVVDLVVRGLVDRGHTLTLFANGSSSVPCRLIPLPGRFSRPISDCVRNTWAIDTEIAREGFDIIHSFGRLAYLWPSLMRGRRVVMTYQRSVTPRSVKLGLVLSRNKVRFTAVGKHLVKNLKGEWSIIPNGVDTDQFSYNPSTTSDAPLTFLGRIEYIKGAHLAVEVAKQSCRKLIIMGNVEPRHKDYFDERIRPHIDSENVVFMGAVDDATKGRLLRNSAALLMPVLWDEPFGIVMVEALACGTPVIGLNRGSVPEVIVNGVTGFVCKDVEQMSAAVKRIDFVNRKNCRSDAESRFSQSAIVAQYESLYERGANMIG